MSEPRTVDHYTHRAQLGNLGLRSREFRAVSDEQRITHHIRARRYTKEQQHDAFVYLCVLCGGKLDDRKAAINQNRPRGRSWLRGLNSSILRPEVAITMRTLDVFSRERYGGTILQNN